MSELAAKTEKLKDDGPGEGAQQVAEQRHQQQQPQGDPSETQALPFWTSMVTGSRENRRLRPMGACRTATVRWDGMRKRIPRRITAGGLRSGAAARSARRPDAARRPR